MLTVFARVFTVIFPRCAVVLFSQELNGIMHSHSHSAGGLSPKLQLLKNPALTHWHWHVGSKCGRSVIVTGSGLSGQPGRVVSLGCGAVAVWCQARLDHAARETTICAPRVREYCHKIFNEFIFLSIVYIISAAPSPPATPSHQPPPTTPPQYTIAYVHTADQ